MTQQIEIDFDQLWPIEMQECSYHGLYNPAAYYETVRQWQDAGCPLCNFEVVGYEI